MKRALIALVLLGLHLQATTVLAQNVSCATRPAGDNSNACASTAFVHSAVGPLNAGGAVGTVLAGAGLGVDAVWSSAPSLSVSLTAPLLIGGTAAGSDLAFRTTTGNGSGDDFIWQGGNNGASERMRLTSSGLTLPITFAQSYNSVAGSGTVLGASIATTRSTTAGTTDLTFAFRALYTDSGTTNSAQSAAIWGQSTYNNGTNTGINTTIRAQTSFSANVNLIYGNYIYVAGTAGTVASYYGLQIEAPQLSGGAAITNKRAINVVNGSGSIVQNDTTASTSSATGAITAAGGVGAAGAINAGTWIASGSVASSTVLAVTCDAAARGRRWYVTDANSGTFGVALAAGGANNVPVNCNGTQWVVG